MEPKIKLIVLFVTVIVNLLGNSYEECLCNVRLRGEYCGTELNRRNGNNDCDKNIYFCGENNRNKSAIILAKCNDESKCDQEQMRFSFRTKRRNDCLRTIRCKCPQGIGRGPHCSSKLIGDDCPSNLVFRCRPRGDISARDACPDGCSDGKCINSVD